MNDIIKKSLAFARNALRRAISFSLVDSAGLMLNNRLCVHWFNRSHDKYNFGDVLNPVILEKLTYIRVVSSTHVLNIMDKPVIYFIGSILDNLNNRNAVICGAGFQKEDARVKARPLSVLAVRGPLSRNILLHDGIDCPKVYGDPAILLPYLQNDSKRKKWDVGIIAHYIDKKILKNTHIQESGLTYKIIDICSLPCDVISEICSSKYIMSSSLHGIIVAHAYGVPATWVRFSDNIIGGDFKFRDYANSVGISEISSYDIEGSIDLKHGVKLATLYNQESIRETLFRVICEYFGVNNVFKS